MHLTCCPDLSRSRTGGRLLERDRAAASRKALHDDDKIIISVVERVAFDAIGHTEGAVCERGRYTGGDREYPISGDALGNERSERQRPGVGDRRGGVDEMRVVEHAVREDRGCVELLENGGQAYRRRRRSVELDHMV